MADSLASRIEPEAASALRANRLTHLLLALGGTDAVVVMRLDAARVLRLTVPLESQKAVNRLPQLIDDAYCMELGSETKYSVGMFILERFLARQGIEEAWRMCQDADRQNISVPIARLLQGAGLPPETAEWKPTVIATFQAAEWRDLASSLRTKIVPELVNQGRTHLAQLSADAWWTTTRPEFGVEGYPLIHLVDVGTIVDDFAIAWGQP
jgi:hypothetical protein